MATYEHLNKDGLLDYFESIGIKSENIHTVEHPEVFTVDKMMDYLKDVDGIVAKNLFLKDKNKGLWLFSARHDVEVNLGELSKKVGAKKGLRFADESVLQEKLGVSQGCVTAYALVNDKKQEVKFIVDDELLSDKYKNVYFHPLVNSASTGMSPKDFMKFLEKTGHPPIKVNLDKT